MLTIIEREARTDGGHGLQGQSHRSECWLDGWIAVPPELEQAAWDCRGYCTLDIQDGVLVGLTPNETPESEPELEMVDYLPQMRAAMFAYAATATGIPDAYALEMPDLFPAWETVLAAGEEMSAGQVIRQGDQLYRVVQAVTPQEGQVPGGEGMLALYRPIDQAHAGTQEDPIPWAYGMDCAAGTYYSYNGAVYRVAEGGDMPACVWPPDTQGMWQWETVEPDGQ